MMNISFSTIISEVKNRLKTVQSLTELQALQAQYLGNNGQLTQAFKQLKTVPIAEKKAFGQQLNQVKTAILDLIAVKQAELKTAAIDAQLAKTPPINPTLPAVNFAQGHYHLLTLVAQTIKAIFKPLGYTFVTSQEVETVDYNFHRLNIDGDHPARAEQDTFYLNPEQLLRTHVTNASVRALSEAKTWPLAVISIGKVYRRDRDDATHSHQFMQLDGIMVGPGVNFAVLKWTLNYFCTAFFGPKTKTRFRPSFFPFTEPSVEVDISCTNCHQKGCYLCKQTGWIEILGAGMVHPEVFKRCHQSPDLTGIAFGIGLERLAMLKYHVDDIRRFYTNDYRFLNQFDPTIAKEG